MKITLIIMLLVILLIFVLLNRQQENFKATTPSPEPSFTGYLFVRDLYLQVPDKDGLFTTGDNDKKKNAVFTFVPDSTRAIGSTYDGKLMYNGKQVYYRDKYTKINGKTSEDNSLTINDLEKDNAVYYQQIGDTDNCRLYSDYVEIYFYSTSDNLVRKKTSNYHSSFTIKKI